MDNSTGQYDEELGRVICGARRSKGGKCRSFPMANGRCRSHGGASPPPGPTHPGWKHGRASKMAKALPEKLREAFVATMSDPDHLSLSPEIALLDSRIMELYRSIDTGATEEAWEAIGRRLAQMRSILDRVMARGRASRKEIQRLRTLTDELQERADEGEPDAEVWDELRTTIRVREQLVETEVKRRDADQLSMQRDEIVGFVAWLVNVLTQHVTDREALTGVLREVEKLLGGVEEEALRLLPKKGKEIVQ